MKFKCSNHKGSRCGSPLEVKGQAAETVKCERCGQSYVVELPRSKAGYDKPPTLKPVYPAA